MAKETTDADRAAWLKTATGDKADALRKELTDVADSVDYSKLSPEQWRLVAAFHAAGKMGEHRPPPVRVRL